MGIDTGYWKLAPGGRDICLNCPVSNCVHDLGYPGDVSDCPLEPDPKEPAAPQPRGVEIAGRIFYNGEAILASLREIERIVSTQPLTFSQLVQRVGRDNATLRRWGRWGLLRVSKRHMPMDTKRGNRWLSVQVVTGVVEL